METGISTAKLDYESGERFQRLRNDLGVSSFGLNLMLFQPGGRSRVHRHAQQEEVYLVLEGTLTLSVEGEETDYEVGGLHPRRNRGAPPARQSQEGAAGAARAGRPWGARGPRRHGVRLVGGDRAQEPGGRGIPYPNLPESELR